MRSLIANLFCFLGALSCYSCGSYLLYYTFTTLRGYDKIGLELIYTEVLCKAFPEWFDIERRMSVTELSIVTVGLVIAYSFLIYNIRKYFKDYMILEIKSLSFLFASFMMAYCLRTFYQLGLGHYKDLQIFNNAYERWWLMNYLWIIWDIVSIISILILHHLNFRPK